MPLQVLIAEDMALIAMDLEALVEKMGHEVVASVTTAEAAVGVARRTRVDLALMDIRLGHGGDGITAALALRRELGIRSIFITAHSDAHTRSRAAAAEPVGFLLKPLSPSQLARLLKQVSGPRPQHKGSLAGPTCNVDAYEQL
jgi:DNA-binding NarL/FixJ family response regulator